MGCRTYGRGMLAGKKFLILDKEKYRYLKVISDISGNDIRAHNDNDENLIREVRNWIRTTTARSIPAANQIWADFNVFSSNFTRTCKEKGYNKADVEQMPIKEYIYFVKKWIKATDSN